MDSSARLGPYEIKGFLTDIGLDDLYLGADTRRDAEILLRVLSVFIDEEDTVERLRQRAQRIAALDNPNLLSLSTIKKSDGAVLAIAPRPAGGALDHFIPADGLLARDVFDLSLALSAAVGALHANDMVHGYLHAGRVIVSDERDLRLLVIGPEEAERTLPPRAAVCRAPEVWAGEELDQQAEVFALGVLLYQLATGELPFGGETTEELAASIQSQGAPPITKARPELPRELAMIVARCLKKDRELRYASATQVHTDLTELKKAIAAGKVTFGRQQPSEPEPGEKETAPPASHAAAVRLGTPSWAGDWRLAAAGAVVLLALGFLLGRVLGGGETAATAPPPAKATRATHDAGPELFPRLSPDGERLFYARAEDHDWGVYAQSLADGEVVELTADSAAGDSQPALSPDGGRIAFRSEREGGGIFVMRSDGGAALRLAESGYNPAWSPDGSALAVADVPVYDAPYLGVSGAISIIDTVSGAARPLPGAAGLQPDWSPSGDRIAYWATRGVTASDIWTIAADGGEPVAVTDDSFVDWSPVWSPDGEYLYFVSNRSGSMDIWRIAVDAGSGAVRGVAEAVTSGASVDALHPSFARDTGAMVYVEASSRHNIYSIPFNASAGTVTGLPELLPGLASGAVAPDLSSDGNRVAFVRLIGDEQQVWVAGLDGSGAHALTDRGAHALNPRLSPDGRRVAFLSDQSGSLQLWTAPAGGGAAQRLTELTTREMSAPVWSRDGASIGMSVGGAMLPSYTLLFDADATPETQVADTLLASPSDRAFEPHSWSRNGNRIAGSIRDGNGRLNGIAVLQEGAEQYQRLTDFGMYPVWLRDGRRLLFQWGSSLYLVDSRSPEPRHIFSAVPDRLGEVFSLSDDERRIYVSLERREGDAWVLTR